jgi:hypothetical protein
MFWKNQLVPSSGKNDVIEVGKAVSPTKRTLNEYLFSMCAAYHTYLMIFDLLILIIFGEE